MTKQMDTRTCDRRHNRKLTTRWNFVQKETRLFLNTGILVLHVHEKEIGCNMSTKCLEIDYQIIKNYRPNGRTNHGRPSKRFVDV